MNHCPPSSSRWPHDIVSCLANNLSQNNENVDDFLASVDAILEEVEQDDNDTHRSPQPSSDIETDEEVDVDTLLTDLSTIYDEMMTQPTHTTSTPPRPPHSPLSFVRCPPFAPLTPFYYHPHPQSVSGIAGTLTPLNIPNTANTANTPCWVLHQMGHDTYLATTRKGVGGVQWMVHASEMVAVEDCRRVTEEEDGMNDVLRMVDDVLLKEQEQEPQQPQERPCYPSIGV